MRRILLSQLLVEDWASPRDRVIALVECRAVAIDRGGARGKRPSIPDPSPFAGEPAMKPQSRAARPLRAIAAPRGLTPAPRQVQSLRPVQSGEAYRIASPPVRGLVTHELAQALETVFARFASERGFTSGKPIEIHLSRGFKPGAEGHDEGRAADIVAVGEQGLQQWKEAWEQAIAASEKSTDSQRRTEAVAEEKKRNLGYGLYKALQDLGGWRVNSGGWSMYRGVMQLFGPWTDTEGPWRRMQIEHPSQYQRQRLTDQQWVLRSHQDHIHVAK